MAILDEVRGALIARKYRITGHAADEMLADMLSKQDVLSATFTGEVIEDYPKAFPFPACLVLGRTADGNVVHAVWAFDRTSWYAVLGHRLPARPGTVVSRLSQAGEPMKTQGPTACPRCGGDLDPDRQIERSVREGTDVALVNIVADVCTRCGETLLHPGMVELLTHAREVLRKGSAAPAVGRVYDLRNQAA